MPHQYWATLSIYDHRAPYYKAAMLLFDRLVVPVPTQTWKGLSDPQELDRLSQQVDRLQGADCAVRVDWDPLEFQEWQANELGLSAATASRKPVDGELNTRYHLEWLIAEGSIAHLPTVDPRSVTVMPVFDSSASYNAAEQDILGVDEAQQQTLEIVLDAFQVAPPDLDIDRVLRLREAEFVSQQVRRLREWQLGVAEDLLEVGDDPGRRELRTKRAALDLQRAVDDYRNAMSSVVEAPRQGRLTTWLSVANPIRFAEATTAPSTSATFTTRGETSWRRLENEEFAFAGILCGLDQ